MNRRLKRLIEDEERTAAKIEELQSHLKDLRLARKQEEDLEIVRSIRTMKLGARELFSLLSGIQDGSVSIESLPDQKVEDEEVPTEDLSEMSEADVGDEEEIQIMKSAEGAPESEDKYHE